MEIIFISILSVFVTWLWFNHAPMHEIRDALYVQNIANQEHKHAVSTTKKSASK